MVSKFPFFLCDVRLYHAARAEWLGVLPESKPKYKTLITVARAAPTAPHSTRWERLDYPRMKCFRVNVFVSSRWVVWEKVPRSRPSFLYHWARNGRERGNAFFLLTLIIRDCSTEGTGWATGQDRRTSPSVNRSLTLSGNRAEISRGNGRGYGRGGCLA